MFQLREVFVTFFRLAVYIFSISQVTSASFKFDTNNKTKGTNVVMGAQTNALLMTKVFDGIIIHTERVMNGNEQRLDAEP